MGNDYIEYKDSGSVVISLYVIIVICVIIGIALIVYMLYKTVDHTNTPSGGNVITNNGTGSSTGTNNNVTGITNTTNPGSANNPWYPGMQIVPGMLIGTAIPQGGGQLLPNGNVMLPNGTVVVPSGPNTGFIPHVAPVPASTLGLFGLPGNQSENVIPGGQTNPNAPFGFNFPANQTPTAIGVSSVGLGQGIYLTQDNLNAFTGSGFMFNNTNDSQLILVITPTRVAGSGQVSVSFDVMESLSTIASETIEVTLWIYGSGGTLINSDTKLINNVTAGTWSVNNSISVSTNGQAAQIYQVGFLPSLKGVTRQFGIRNFKILSN